METLSFKEWVEYHDCLTESKQLITEISVLLEQGVEIDSPQSPESSSLTEKSPQIEDLEREGQEKHAEIEKDLSDTQTSLKNMLGKIARLITILGKASLGTIKLPWTILKIIWNMLVYLAKLGIRMLRLAYLTRQLHRACAANPMSRQHPEEKVGAYIQHRKRCKHLNSLVYKEFINVVKGMGWTVPFGVAWPILSEPLLHELGLGASALALVVTVWKGFGIMLHHIIDDKLLPFVEDESIPEDTRKKIGKAIVDTLPDFVRADAEAQVRSIFQTITHVEKPKEWTICQNHLRYLGH
ncbi:MAG: hypothetical protein ACXADB_11685 [Candidatus Hermodarchaeia archaeon]|jgi:hypothetical protein